MKDNNTNQYAIQCIQDEAKAILDMIPRIDDNFANAVDVIYQCKGKVIVTGVGKSGHVGEKIAATLASLGTPSFFLNPLDAYHGDLGMVAAGDIVIAISYSGNTDELLRIIPLLKKRNIPIIGISGNSESLLAQHSTFHLNVHVEKEADPLNLAPTSSTTATMVMGDALACALVRVRNFQSEDFALFHPGGSLGKRLLTHVKDVMQSDNLPIVTEDTILTDALVQISKCKSGLAVVVENNKMKGLISDGDVRRAFQKYKQECFDIAVNQIMTKYPKCIRESASLEEAVAMFHEVRLNTLIVLDSEDHLVGILNYRDCNI